MADNRNIDPKRATGPVDKRPRRSGPGLIVSIVIIVLVLIGFFVWNNSGFQEPPSEAVAPENTDPYTEAPSETQQPRAAVPQEASPDAPVRPEPGQENGQQ